ncbi:hypothetical protein LVD15_25890 [Fulvivirga maritima]|uniref:hypothetical protein n=1 Tax=Fulvivirga maritima TaxID=2904247 RepID=UPI001F2F50B3|nr:hypothetical protein [Fulvivirga maritima]UII26686.1 hypothetical protein LVD15_25890 [Fulvivirga maritima]
MKDKLEDFIKDNRDQFDDQEPSQKVWAGIETHLPEKKRTSYQWLWKAAAVVFFLSSVYLFLRLETVDQPQLVADNSLAKEFKSVESFYFQEISEKKGLIYDFESESANVDADFEQDLQKLDAMYEVLKEELMQNPSKKVVDALILNLLVRVDILNSQLEKLDQVKESKKEDDEAKNA